MVAYFQGLQNCSAGLLLCIRSKRAVESFEREFKSEQGGTNAFHCHGPTTAPRDLIRAKKTGAVITAKKKHTQMELKSDYDVFKKVHIANPYRQTRATQTLKMIPHASGVWT